MGCKRKNEYFLERGNRIYFVDGLCWVRMRAGGARGDEAEKRESTKRDNSNFKVFGEQCENLAQ